MRIIVQSRTGGPETLELVERPDPRPGPGELLVRVAAAGINPVDVAVSRGVFALLGAPPFTTGWDVAGTVTALGEGVTGFAVGDRVFGMPRFPAQAAAYAELAVVPAAEMALTPAALTDVQAGALPLAGLTAWQGLVTEGGVGPGQQVLIHSGAGGVGHLAVQIAHARGARVTATASAGKLDLVRDLGADTVLDYRSQTVTAPGEGFDLVLDPQAGAQGGTSVALTRPGGRVVFLLDPGDATRAAAAARGVAVTRLGVRPDAAGLRALAALAEAGKLRPIVARAFPLAEAGAAQDYLSATHPAGKVVLEP